MSRPRPASPNSPAPVPSSAVTGVGVGATAGLFRGVGSSVGDGAGTLYAQDHYGNGNSGDRVLRIDRFGTVTDFAAPSGLSTCTSQQIGWHPTLGVLLWDITSNTVLRFNSAGQASAFSTVEGIGGGGSCTHSGVPGVFGRVYGCEGVAAVGAGDRDHGRLGFIPMAPCTQGRVDALRIVMSGGLFVPHHLFGPNRGRPPEAAGPQDLPGAVAKSLEHLGLTPRQHDVLSGLLKGLPNKLIARELSLSVDTVKDHVASVLRALNVTSRTQAVLAVSRMAQGQPGAVSWRRGRHG